MYPAQQNATDQSTNFFWILVAIVGVVVIVWWLFRQYIVIPVYWFRIHEIDLIKGVVEVWAPFAAWLHLPMPPIQKFSLMQQYMQGINPKTVNLNTFEAINNYVGDFIRWPVAFTLFILAGIAYFRHGSSRFQRTFNMDTLKKQEAENWPQIKAVLSTDLVKQDLEKGPWAMAKLPLDFCRENNLVNVAKKDKKNIWVLDQAKAQHTFALQLGQLWYGPQALPIHTKTILVICVARAQREHAVAKRFLTQISASAASGKLDFTGVEQQLQKYKKSKVLRWLEKRHAYVYTLMMTLLEIARTDGVLATSEFLWLKPVDRRLWYILNSVGRQTSVIEVSGIFAHWLAEKKISRPLKTPMVKEAAKGLDVCIKETLYVAEGERWHSSAA